MYTKAVSYTSGRAMPPTFLPIGPYSHGYLTGLNEKNCMCGMVPLHNHDRSAKYKALGLPLKQTIPFVDLWKQRSLFILLGSLIAYLHTGKFYLSDFSLAMKPGNLITQYGYLLMQFCSQDQLYRKAPSFACSMWSYTVTFPELYLGHLPFLRGLNME